MNLRVINAMLLCGPLLFAGCATTTQEQTADKPDSVVLPFESPEAPMDELDADAVFSALVGEIATQRGDLETAYRHQLQTAVITGMPRRPKGRLASRWRSREGIWHCVR